MIRRLLVANRGEIALRVIAACRELGIETVAVFSDIDAAAPHVSAADRSVAIGGAPAQDSYLSIPHLIDAARSQEADAVHPGYGFLSESAEFAQACVHAGLVFVGPPADVIARMGSKVAARQLMQDAGVPTVPGITPREQDDAGVERAVDEVGYPALIKASAGGGGKGMRELRPGMDALDAIRSARREAISAFGDGTLYVERLLDRPRHIEIQIIADHHGRVEHLFERECSVQRRHQKVIEESPSPALTPALRERMTTAAVTAARAVGYLNAGTIEFLVEGEGDEARFYFLEMNTRLQVEHAVTEAVAGVDLVRAQLLVASGEPLPWPAASLVQRGHAIEARVYAEDPARDFMPQAGRLLLYREPRLPGVRIDAGVREGGDIPVQYDPMIAKVIAAAETRETARLRLIAALRAFPILGVRTNIPFLVRVLSDARFRDAAMDTGFLDREGGALAQDPELPPFLAAALADIDRAPHAASAHATSSTTSASDPWSTLNGWRG